MLVLSGKSGQQFMIGDDIRVTVVGVQGGRVTLGIEAPRDQRVLRGELCDRPDEPLIVEVLTAHEPTPLSPERTYHP
jgi:carbon storage regulator